MIVTLDDLQSGRVVRVKQQDFCRLTGESMFTAERNRVIGKGCRFRKETGRIWYYTIDILEYLNIPASHSSTSEYDTSSHIARLDKARRALAESGKNKGRKRKDPSIAVLQTAAQSRL